MDEKENVTSLTPYLAKKNRERIAVPVKGPPAYYIIIKRLPLQGPEKGRFEM